MRMHTIDYVLWCITPVLMTAIVTSMYRRRLHREFPFFFNYAIFQILTFAVEFPLRKWVNYYYVYWTCSALSMIVTFAVLPGNLQRCLSPVRGPARFKRHSVSLVCPGRLAGGGMWAITSWRANQMDNITNGILPGRPQRPHDAVRVGVLHVAVQRISGHFKAKCCVRNFHRIRFFCRGQYAGDDRARRITR